MADLHELEATILKLDVANSSFLLSCSLRLSFLLCCLSIFCSRGQDLERGARLILLCLNYFSILLYTHIYTYIYIYIYMYILWGLAQNTKLAGP